MNIAIYANEISRKGVSGVKTYSWEIINNLLKVDEKNVYTLYAEKDISPAINCSRARFSRPGKKKRFWAFTVFPHLVRRDRPDVAFVPIQIFPFLCLLKNKPKVVVTVHDVAFNLFPEHFTLLRRRILKWHTYLAVKLADKVIVPSHATKNDILRFYKVNPEKIKVVYHGYSRSLAAQGKKNDPRVIGLVGDRPFILFVGSVQPRKNITGLVHSFEMLKATGNFDDFKLVICGGKGWLYKRIFAEIDRSPASSDIVVVGNAGNDLLASLYANATVFVMPSLYEGFGLPVLEAMSLGDPVICADNSSLSEVAGGAALLVDGYSVEDMYRKLEMVLTDKKLRQQLSMKSLERAKDFSWEKAARETLSVIESLG